jgi:hypothetical protein
MIFEKASAGPRERQESARATAVAMGFVQILHSMGHLVVDNLDMLGLDPDARLLENWFIRIFFSSFVTAIFIFGLGLRKIVVPLSAAVIFGASRLPTRFAFPLIQTLFMFLVLSMRLLKVGVERHDEIKHRTNSYDALIFLQLFGSLWCVYEAVWYCDESVSIFGGHVVFDLVLNITFIFVLHARSWYTSYDSVTGELTWDTSLDTNKEE